MVRPDLGGRLKPSPAGGVLRAIAIVVATPAIAGAHPVAEAVTPENVWRAWTFEPVVTTLLIASAVAYAIGVTRLWRAAGTGAAIARYQVWSFAAGWLATAIALVSPVDGLGSALFAAHMVQHELLMLVAAPLIVFGAPHIAFLRVLSRRGRHAVGGVLAGRAHVLIAFLAAPATAWLLHAVAIWTWHTPQLFDAAVRNDAVHAAQHLSFFGTAALFWWGLTHGRYGRLGYGAAVVYVFTTTLYTGLLGALLTISPHPWYRVYTATTAAFGLTPLEDQQLGGLIMWAPASVIYTAVGLVLFALWVKESERRVTARPVDGSAAAASHVGQPPPTYSIRSASVVLAALAIASVLSACGEDRYTEAAAMTGGDPGRGRQALSNYGCVTCHTIPGIREADALVGPPLTRIASRVYLAGHLPNTPDNMMRWIRHPRQEDPRTAMPDTGVTDLDARDIAAYLYTLR